MNMNEFLVDAYFTKYESKANYMMGSSDPESLSLKDINFDISKYENEPLGYALGNGYLPLRIKLSKLYNTISSEQIVLMNGGEETIYVTMKALLSKGDEILVQMPSYQSLSVIAQQMGCIIKEYRPSFEDEWKTNTKELETKITEQTKMLVLNFPHNPTGTCLTKQEMNEIVNLCRKHHLILIADEVYRFLQIDESYPTDSFADLYENAVAFGSFSKTFAAPGLRLGWVVTQNKEIMNKLLAYRHFVSTCSNLPCQWMANELMDHAQEIIHRNNTLIQENAKLFDAFIKEHANLFEYIPPKGATMAYVKLINNQKSMDFCMELLEQIKVLIVPSCVLEENDEYLRIGLGRKSFPKCIEFVNQYLENK